MRAFDAGEPAVQEVAGDSEQVGRVLRGMRHDLSGGARDFLERRRMLFVASVDGDDVWASVLYGEPGFVATPDERTVLARARGPRIAPGPVGLLAIERSSCCSTRVHGTGTLTRQGLRVSVDRVSGGCSSARRHTAATVGRGARVRSGSEYRTLSGADHHLIAEADTFYVATAAYGGAVASRRCGPPGLVSVQGGRVQFPDTTGGALYMSLGDVVANPRIGLLFLDWETGDALQLSGGAELDLDSRTVRVEVERAVRTPGAVPYRWILLNR